MRRYLATPMALIVSKQVAKFYGDPPGGAFDLYLGIDDEVAIYRKRDVEV